MRTGKRKVGHILVAVAVILVAVAWTFTGITFDDGMKDWRDGDLIVQQSSDVPVLPVCGAAAGAGGGRNHCGARDAGQARRLLSR